MIRTDIDGDVDPNPPVLGHATSKDSPDDLATSTITVTHHAVFSYISLSRSQPFRVVSCPVARESSAFNIILKYFGDLRRLTAIWQDPDAQNTENDSQKSLDQEQDLPGLDRGTLDMRNTCKISVIHLEASSLIV